MSDPENLASASLEPEVEDWGNFPGAGEIIKLNDNNFTSGISSKDPTLVMFYAPC